MSLLTNIRASIEFSLSKVLAGRGPVDHAPIEADIALASGTGFGNADLAFSDQRTLASAASENLDLAGSLVDGLGQTITAAKIKGLLIEADASNTTNITVGGAASNGLQAFFGATTHTIVLQPGDRFVWVSKTGWPVTAATADLLKVANGSGATGIYRVKIIGASA